MIYLKSALVGLAAAVIAFIAGAIVWIWVQQFLPLDHVSASLPEGQGGFEAGSRDFTLWPVFVLALVVFALASRWHMRKASRTRSV